MSEARESKTTGKGFGRTPSGWRAAGDRPGPQAVLAGALIVAVLFCGASALQRVSPGGSSGQLMDSDHLYTLTNVWTVHLKFAPEQWEVMEPKGGFNPFGGGPGGGRGPGGRPGGFGGFNAPRTLAPVFMSQGDLNRDGRISREEFAILARRWFKAWDTHGAGKLDEGQMRAGLDQIRNPVGGGMMLQGPEGKRNGLASAMGLEFEYVHADMEFEGRRFRDVGVRYKGNGTFLETRNSLKRSLKIDIGKYGNGRSLGDVRMLTLQNNVTDGGLMNEVLAYGIRPDRIVMVGFSARAIVTVLTALQSDLFARPNDAAPIHGERLPESILRMSYR